MDDITNIRRAKRTRNAEGISSLPIHAEKAQSQAPTPTAAMLAWPDGGVDIRRAPSLQQKGCDRMGHIDDVRMDMKDVTVMGASEERL